MGNSFQKQPVVVVLGMHRSGTSLLANLLTVLGVERTATEVQLKASFRKLAMQHHPDRNPGDHQAELRFKEINEAYQVLSDGQKRAAYDRFGHQAFAQGNGAGGPGFGPDFSDFMSDIFDTFFGDTRQRGRGQEPGAEVLERCGGPVKQLENRQSALCVERHERCPEPERQHQQATSP